MEVPRARVPGASVHRPINLDSAEVPTLDFSTFSFPILPKRGVPLSAAQFGEEASTANPTSSSQPGKIAEPLRHNADKLLSNKVSVTIIHPLGWTKWRQTSCDRTRSCMVTVLSN